MSFLNPIYLLIVLGNLMIIAIDVVRVRGMRKRAEEMARPSFDRPDEARTVLYRDGDAYGGAFVAVLFIAISTGLLFFGQLDMWDLSRSPDWSDPGVLARAGLRVGLLVLPATVVTLSFPGEFFVIGRKGIEQAHGKKHTHLAWKEVTSISQYAKDRHRGILLRGRDTEVRVPEGHPATLTFYEFALRELPETLRQDPTYLWMASMAAQRDEGSGKAAR